MTWRLFLDDERLPATGSGRWAVARSSEAAVHLVARRGIPVFMALDHDLGGDDTAMVFLHWLVEYMLDRDMTFPEGFDFYVHSRNPVGAGNIEGFLRNFMADRAVRAAEKAPAEAELLREMDL